MAKEDALKRNTNSSKFNHLNEKGDAHMVDISHKPVTKRIAIASVYVNLSKSTLEELHNNPKGDVIATARIAGITSAKQTSSLIPLCHPIPLHHVEISIDIKSDGIQILSKCTTKSETGVEMEAMTSAAVSALTIYDMCKSFDRSIEITKLHLLEKSGGRSGHYIRN